MRFSLKDELIFVNILLYLYLQFNLPWFKAELRQNSDWNIPNTSMWCHAYCEKSCINEIFTKYEKIHLIVRMIIFIKRPCCSRLQNNTRCSENVTSIRHQIPINHIRKTVLWLPENTMGNIFLNITTASSNQHQFRNLLQVRKPTQNEKKLHNSRKINCSKKQYSQAITS